MMKQKTKTFSSIHRSSFIVQNVLPNGSRHPIVIVGERCPPARVAKALAAVAHQEGMARELEHLIVVVVVTDGHHFAGTDSGALRPERQRPALGAAAIHAVQDGNVAGEVLGP